MATTKYSYRAQDSLSTIAKRYNTNVKTLVALNSWLINPHTKKTEMYPAKIKYTYTMTSDIAATILTEKQIVPGTVYIEAFSGADLTGTKTILEDNGRGAICRKSSNIEIMTIDYTARTIKPKNLTELNTMYKSLNIKYDAALTKSYLIVPLIGNGNTSIEDYWDNVDRVTGISFGSLMENLSTSGDEYLHGSFTLYSPTDNRILTESTLHLLENSGDFAELYDETLENSPSTTGIDEGLYTFDSDFTNARIGGIVQTAINEGSKNMRDYFLYDINHTSGKTLYQRASDPYTLEHKSKTLLGTGSDTLRYNSNSPFIYDSNNKKREPATYISKTYEMDSKTYYGYDLDDSIYSNSESTRTSYDGNWSRNSVSLYKYDTVGAIHRDTAIQQAVTVTIGNTIIYMPCWPEPFQDQVAAEYSTPAALGSSAPYVVYTKTGARSIQFTFKLHREMLDLPIPKLTETIAKNPEKHINGLFWDHEIDKIIRLIESAVYPNYDGSVAAVRTQVKIGNTLYISGVMTDQSTNWYGPIGSDLKYKQCDLSFTVLAAEDTMKSYSKVQNAGR